MQVLGIRELREKTGELARTAQSGETLLITKGGEPLFLSIPFDDDLVKHGVQVKLAIKLYEEGAVTLADAAKLAELSLESFIHKVGLMGIPVVDYSRKELEMELNALN